jgi:aminopeptidase N
MTMRYPVRASVIALLAASPAFAQPATDSLLLRPTHYDLNIQLDLDGQRMSATARIRLRNETSYPVRNASLLLYRLLNVRAVRDSGGVSRDFSQRVVAFEDFGKLQANHILVPLAPALAPGQEVTLELEYGGHVLGYAETGMLYVRDRIDTTYTLLRMDTFAYPQPGYPSMAVNRRAGLPEYDYTARISVPASHTVANGGTLVERREAGATVSYVYRSLKPSWRMDFSVARFTTLRDGDLAVYHLPEDSAGARRILGAMSRTLKLYTGWFGPLRGSASFAVIEIPDGWGSQADVTSILQSAAAFRDSRRESELYHEISHLWNGASGEWPSPRWDEGLATFLEDVTADSLTGTATTDSSAMRVARWLAGRLARDSALRTVPPADYGKRSMTGYSYSVGSLMFFGLYRVVGHDAFRQIVGEYYRRHQAGGGSSAAFVQVAKDVSSIDLTAFFDEWLFSSRWGTVVSAAKRPSDLYERHRRKAMKSPESGAP